VQGNNVQVAPRSTSWGQMLVALGVLTAAGAGAGVLTKVGGLQLCYEVAFTSSLPRYSVSVRMLFSLD
jgi:hypothetical protein